MTDINVTTTIKRKINGIAVMTNKFLLKEKAPVDKCASN